MGQLRFTTLLPVSFYRPLIRWGSSISSNLASAASAGSRYLKLRCGRRIPGMARRTDSHGIGGLYGIGLRTGRGYPKEVRSPETGSMVNSPMRCRSPDTYMMVRVGFEILGGRVRCSSRLSSSSISLAKTGLMVSRMARSAICFFPFSLPVEDKLQSGIHVLSQPTLCLNTRLRVKAPICQISPNGLSLEFGWPIHVQPSCCAFGKTPDAALEVPARTEHSACGRSILPELQSSLPVHAPWSQ